MRLLDLKETSLWRFDEAKAERACRFIEKYCVFHRDRFAGQHFILHPVQRRIVRDLFGWVSKTTGLRRFTDAYWEAAIGMGKSPLLAAMGLYLLGWDNEPGAEVWNFAGTYKQAKIVHDAGKDFVRSHRELSRRLLVKQYEIVHKATRSKWNVVSGKGPGAGCQPTVILGDEVHDWPGPTGYRDLRDRMAKRRQPLSLLATNAAESRSSFCWTLHEQAVKCLDTNGESDPQLYPVICAAPEDAKTDDRAAWRMANPLLGVTIEESRVAENVLPSIGTPNETRMRRLYLSIWPKQAADRWLDLAIYDKCVKPFSAWKVATQNAMLYVGLDLSQSDDMCAAVFVWMLPECAYVHPRFWIPRHTAEFYEQRNDVRYSTWAENGDITLVESETITDETRIAIAAEVLAHQARLRAVCYDRYKADVTIAHLEAKGATCIPVPQGFSLSPGCHELVRRYKEQRIVFAPNDVMRWCAENATIKTDDKGNIWPAKPFAAESYAGRPDKKIDGVSALVTALTEARKAVFPTARKTLTSNPVVLI